MAMSVYPDYVHFKLIKLMLMAKHGGHERDAQGYTLECAKSVRVTVFAIPPLLGWLV
jgi:hypothetical protein